MVYDDFYLNPMRRNQDIQYINLLKSNVDEFEKYLNSVL